MQRIAILGAGAFSDSHIQAYLKCGAECEIVAIVDLFPQKAEQLRSPLLATHPAFKVPGGKLEIHYRDYARMTRDAR